MPGGIRTPNLLIRSQMLYPVELQTQQILDFGFSISDWLDLVVDLAPTACDHSIYNLKWNGVVDGTRTRNNQNHNLGLYH